MSTADPFLPVKPGESALEDDAAQPEDLDHGDASEAVDGAPVPEREEPATAAGEIPVSSTVFQVPTGDTIDPAQDI